MDTNPKESPVSQSVEEWEKEFDSLCVLVDDQKNYRDTLKFFIRDLKRDTLTTLVKKMEGLKHKHKCDENCVEDEAMCNEMDDLMESRNQGISAAVEVVKKMGIT